MDAVQAYHEALMEAKANLAQARADLATAQRDFAARVNARAEADMLAGRPVTGAHHRAIEAELAAPLNERKEG